MQKKMLNANSQAKETTLARRWSLSTGGGICWDVKNETKLPHVDRVEMCGLKLATVVHYGVRANGLLVLKKDVVWPMLRILPNDTHGALSRTFGEGVVLRLAVDGDLVMTEKLVRVHFDGMLRLETETVEGLGIARTIYPANEEPTLIENYVITNNSGRLMRLHIASNSFTEEIDAALGVHGAYVLTAAPDRFGDFQLSPGESVEASLVISGRLAGGAPLRPDCLQERERRLALQNTLRQTLVLETPDVELNEMFALAKLHASESFFATKGGLMHAPGGGLGTETSVPSRARYYAAIWANDQIEYAAPFFACLDYTPGREATENAIRHFARHANDEFRGIPSSIIAEGDSSWNCAGDRGDVAMLAYGIGRYVLARGDRAVAEAQWPFLEWCLEYCRRKTNADGVIASDSDELEGRLPAGDANLHTSVLAYDALLSAAYLARDLGLSPTVGGGYKCRANELRRAIDKHFAVNVEGFDAYRYYAGNTALRAWICSPLTAGIFERQAGTVEALISERLWTADGLLSASNQPDFWDRSTIYALRGLFYAGHADKALACLKNFTVRRLFGDHVPYAVEAQSPTAIEAAQCHLAAESALYARIFSEGLFGLRPTGLRSFSLRPSLPKEWLQVQLKRIGAFGQAFDLKICRTPSVNGDLCVTVTGETGAGEQIIGAGGELEVNFANQEIEIRPVETA
jgi:hypothetical protein